MQQNSSKRNQGQAAMEYLLSLGALVVVALIAFRTLVPTAVMETNGHFTGGAINIVGDAPKANVGGPWP